MHRDFHSPCVNFRKTSRAPVAKGFTLVELMIAIGIIVLLIAILLPMVNSVRKQARDVQCLANQKQLMTAVLAYAMVNKECVPYNGWSNAPTPNWIYNPSSPLVALPAFNQSYVTTGLLWPYFRNYHIFRCPMDDGPWIVNSYQSMGSYIMNGAISHYAANPAATQRITSFLGDDIFFWETPYFANGGGISVNDPSNWPPEGITLRHHNCTSVGCADGHAELMLDSDYLAQCQFGPSRLFCDRSKSDGGFGTWAPRVTNPIPMAY